MTNIEQLRRVYGETSSHLFIFYSSLLQAGFNKDQAFELVRMSVSNSTVEAVVNECWRQNKKRPVRYRDYFNKDTEEETCT
jgi:hypothetical protein